MVRCISYFNSLLCPILADKMESSRASYTREYKLNLIDYYHKNNKNTTGTARKFKVDKKTVRLWIKQEEVIRNMKRKKRCNRFGKVAFPDVEKLLYAEFKERRKKRLLVKGYFLREREGTAQRITPRSRLLLQ